MTTDYYKICLDTVRGADIFDNKFSPHYKRMKSMEVFTEDKDPEVYHLFLHSTIDGKILEDAIRDIANEFSVFIKFYTDHRLLKRRMSS